MIYAVAGFMVGILENNGYHALARMYIKNNKEVFS
jgi:hypothetical protein